MRKFKLALPSALPIEGDDAARSELIDQIVVGKLRVSAACVRFGFSEEQVLDLIAYIKSLSTNTPPQQQQQNAPTKVGG